MSTEQTRVVHVEDNIPGAVYIGRPNPRHGLKGSKWANPYKIGEPTITGMGHLSRQMVIRRYRNDLGGVKRHLLSELPELRGKPLACWCRHAGEERSDDTACHGDVLVELLKSYTDDELRAMGGKE
jgi:hypothetical protein